MRFLCSVRDGKSMAHMPFHPSPTLMTDITNQFLYPFPLNLKSTPEFFSKRSTARIHGTRLILFATLESRFERVRIIQKSS